MEGRGCQEGVLRRREGICSRGMISSPLLGRRETRFVELCRKAGLSAQFSFPRGILSAELAELSGQKLRR